MTKEEVITKITNKFYYVDTILVGIVINDLEEMDLIKFESEKERTIKEAEKYLIDYFGYKSDLIRRLVALLK